MKAIHLRAYGPTQNLALVEIPEPHALLLEGRATPSELPTWFRGK